MLVLSRKQGEKILIDGGRIVITVIELRGKSVRIAVEAPREMAINREEIQEKIDRGILREKPPAGESQPIAS